jgi:hypothetical protein
MGCVAPSLYTTIPHATFGTVNRIGSGKNKH